MTPRPTAELLDRLRQINTDNRERCAQLAVLDEETLHLRPRPKAWNALECLAHLNEFHVHYLAELRRRIDAAPRQPQAQFTSGWLGNKFAAGMKPGPKTRAVSALPNMNPVNWERTVNRDEIERLTTNLKTMEGLLRDAAAVDLTKTKVTTALPIIRPRIRLGDALRTVIYHDWRHLEQALRAAGGT